MPISNETTAKRIKVETNVKREIVSGERTNPSLPWFLDYAHYPKREGNELTPYISGEEIFRAIHDSIKNAKKSVDIVAWGFDPAIPLIREDASYNQDYEYEKRAWGGLSKEMVRTSPWRKEDTYGETIFKALENNPNLRIRLIIWYANIVQGVHVNSADNIIGVTGCLSQETITATIKDSGLDFNDFPKGKIPLRPRHPEAVKYSEEWFSRVQHGDIAEFPYLDRLTVAFRSMPYVTPTEEDVITGEAGSMWAIPTHHQKNILVDFDDENKRHGYMMGHNGVAYYWSRFPFVHRDVKAEMDSTPYHDFSMKVRGPALIDMNENFCDAWASRFTFQKLGRLGTFKTHTTRANDNEDAETLRAQRRQLYDSILKAVGPGKADCQVVRTYPTTNLDYQGKPVDRGGMPEKEIKDAYLQVTRHARNYIFIVNQYCQYPKLIRHIKYWWKQYRGNDKSRELYIFMGTCVPEKEGQIFRAEQMANELGVGVQFQAHSELYKEGSTKSSENKEIPDYAEGTLNRGRTIQGVLHGATKENIDIEEIKAMGIFPVFFKFYTPIPKNGTQLVDKLAQQVYVHAKLMIQDDVVMTLGSTNLNTRSMSVDSEINLFTSDSNTALNFRRKLWHHYCGENEGEKFPNKGVLLKKPELQDIYKIFVDVAEENVRKIKRRSRIKGLIATFSDPRSIVALTNVRVG